MEFSARKPKRRGFLDVHGEKKRMPLRGLLAPLAYGRNVLNLRPGFGRRHPVAAFIVLAAAASGVFFGIRGLLTRAEVQDFFPLTCLGSWQNPSNAQGKPESLAASGTAITAGNASVFDPIEPAAQIFCGAFVPPDFNARGNIKSVGLTLVWDIPDFAATTTNADGAAGTSPTPTPALETPTGTSAGAIIKQFASFFTVALADDAASATDARAPDAGANTIPTSSDTNAAPLPPSLAPTTTPDVNAASDTNALPDKAPLQSAPIPAMPGPDKHFLKVSYSLDGQTWLELASVGQENWQNFTATLPVASWDDLAKLQVKIEGVPTSLAQIPKVYLDGMFIEAHYEVPPLALPLGGDNAGPSEESATSTVIILPPAAVPVPANQNSNFRADESPTFDFDLNALPAPVPEPTSSPPTGDASTTTSFAPPRAPLSFFFRAAGAAFSEAAGRARAFLSERFTAHAQSFGPDLSQLPDSGNPVAARIFGPGGDLTDFRPTTLVTGSNLRVILPNPGRSFRPGRYAMNLLIWQNGTVYSTESDFTWGVLAVNFNKSIYALHDPVAAGFGVLDDAGHTICDARIDMTVVSPGGRRLFFSTTNGTIARNQSCGPGTVTNAPDYSAALSADEAGTYAVSVRAATKNGPRTASDKFEVQNPPLFDVERFAPTRIFPPARYDVSFSIKASRDFSGDVVETVPSSFDVSSDGAQAADSGSDTKTITWPVNMKAGDLVSPSYSFKAPDVSPELYKLGPLQIGSWQETRQWQIAADAPGATFVATSTCGTANTTSTVNCAFPQAITNGDTLFFVIGERATSSLVSSVTQSGASWSRNLSAASSSGATVEIWSASNVQSAVTSTKITLTRNATTSVILAEFSGVWLASSTSVDKTATSTSAAAGTTARTGQTAATTQANELWLGGINAIRVTAMSSPSNGFTLQATSTGSTTAGTEIGLLYKLASSTGNATSAITLGSSTRWAGAIVAFKAQPTITIGNGAEPAPTTIGPNTTTTAGANATTSGLFSFQADVGTSTITGVTTTLATTTGVYQVIIASTGTTPTIFGSSTAPFSGNSFFVNTTSSGSNMNVSSTLTNFQILVSPLTYASMTALSNAMWTITSTITAWNNNTSFQVSGTNTTSSIITIDHKSPADVAGASGAIGDTQNILNWTNPGDTDFSTTTVVRATSSVTWSPVWGTYYATSTNIGATNTIACVLPSSTANCTDIGLANGTAYYYKIFTADRYLNYSGGTVPSGNPFTPSKPPAVAKVVLNASSSITLNPATTTAISVVASTTADVSPILYATSTIYRSGVSGGSGCTADSRNCYQLASSSCVFSNATTTVTCTANIYYFADATDASSSYGPQNWQAAVAATDAGGQGGSSSTASGVDLLTLLAINITTSSIGYGLVPASTTSANFTTTIQNAGNSSTTLQISGTALVKGASVLATSSQHYASSSFIYGGSEQQLNGSPTTVPGFLLTGPTSTVAVQGDIFWGIYVPALTATGTYNGTTTFTAVFSS